MKKETPKKVREPVLQDKQPGKAHKMHPKPEYMPKITGQRLKNKVALITGGDSGIGRAISIAFAAEGALVMINYLNEHQDAEETVSIIEKMGGQAKSISGDVADEKTCKKIIKATISAFGTLDILVNNAGVQFPQKSILNITDKQLKKTFKTNIFSQFYLTKAALKYLKEGSSIICTTSVTAFRGSPGLLDYSSTKGAITSFVRSLSANLAEKGIRVNGVAPGPIWTPLIPATFDRRKVAEFGSDVPLKRAGQPNEVAPCYVFLASDDASYITGQILHPNGGEIVNA